MQQSSFAQENPSCDSSIQSADCASNPIITSGDANDFGCDALAMQVAQKVFGTAIH